MQGTSLEHPTLKEKANNNVEEVADVGAVNCVVHEPSEWVLYQENHDNSD